MRKRPEARNDYNQDNMIDGGEVLKKFEGSWEEFEKIINANITDGQGVSIYGKNYISI